MEFYCDGYKSCKFKKCFPGNRLGTKTLPTAERLNLSSVYNVSLSDIGTGLTLEWVGPTEGRETIPQCDLALAEHSLNFD